MRNHRESESTNAALGVEGPGELVEALGRVWEVTSPTLQTEAAYEAWMVLRARKGLLALRGVADRETYRAEERRLQAAEIRDDYRWGGPVWADVVESAVGAKYLFYLLLRQRHPDVTPDRADEVAREGGELAGWATRAALHRGNPALFSPPGGRPGTSETDTTTTDGP